MDEKRELFGFRLCYGTVDQGDYISKEYSPGYCERFWASVRVTENIKEAFGNGDTPLGAIHDAANKWRDKYSPADPPLADPVGGGVMTYKDLINCPECKRVVTVSEINANGGICGTCRINRHAPAAPPPADPAPDDRLAEIRERYPQREPVELVDCPECEAEGETCYCNIDAELAAQAEWQLGDDITFLLDLVDDQQARIRALEAERNRYLYEMVASQESLLETEHEVVGLYAERDALAARLAAARKALSRSVFPHDSYEVLFSQCVQMIKDALAALDAPDTAADAAGGEGDDDIPTD